MRHIGFVCVALAIGGLLGCASSEERAAKARAQIEEERLKIMRQYTECLEKHEGTAACERYRKAAESIGR